MSRASHNALVPLSLSSLCPCALREDAGNKGGQITAGGERSDAITRFEVNEFGDVLVPVKGIEEFVVAVVGDHKERTRSHLL